MRKIAQAPLYTVLALLLGGCMIGPDYVRPTIDAPTAWRVSDPAAQDLAATEFGNNSGNNLANTAWWEQFNDPVLNALIVSALHGSKDLLSASARVDEFIGHYGASRGDLYPQLGLGYGVTQQKNAIPGTNVIAVYDSYDAVLNASWEIDLWGKIRRQSEAGRAQLIASEAGKQGVILSLVASVASGYINLRALDRQLEIATRTAQTRETTYALFQDRYAGGVISILELSQNKAQLEEALASVPSLQKAVAQQENALSLLLGRNPGPIARGKAIDALSAPAIPAGLPSSLLERRPDIRQAEQSLIAANAQIGAAKATYFPSITLTGLSGVASSGLSTLFSTASRFWQVGAALNLPIFTAGKISSQVQVAEAQQQQALFAYQKAIQSAFRDVNDALIDQDRTRVQQAAQGRQVDALRQYAETAVLRYDNGYTSYMEVLDAERNLFSAQLQYATTQQGRLQAMVNLYKAMGGGWVAEAEKLSTAPAERPLE